jgi:hypothetical protein
MAEFWYNSSYHTSLGCSPFQALYGIEPNFGALPNLSTKATPTIAELAAERQNFIQLLREHLLRAQARIKAYADKNRTEREFQVGEDVLLKLQPYAQTSVINRPCAKLAFKYFGPFKIIERFGMVAYKLALPQDCSIHPVFHISQLKPFTPNYAPVYDKLPAPPDVTAAAVQPIKIVERRLVKKGNAAVPQIRVQWSHIPPEHTTWEDYHVLRTRFPEAAIWEGDLSRGGDNVTTRSTPESDMEKVVQSPAHGPGPSTSMG